jgi:membrane-bound metal-dependent hydrolase YbcI (DUF457 family)
MGAAAHGILGTIGGFAPDALEPATSPNHRRFLHSWALVLFGTIGLKRVLADPRCPEELKYMALALASGYGSHLAAGATTPKGLPWF